MSTLPMTATAADVAREHRTTPSLFSRMRDAWSRYQARLARSYIDQALKRYSDEELKEMGYGSIDVARIRAANQSAPQHWL